MKDKKLLIVGELNVDLILNDIGGFPKIGTEIVANQMDFTLGSSSAIMASNISVMGTKTAFCGKIGLDRFGEFVQGELKKKNVDTRFISNSQNHKTGITVVMNYDQDRANVTYCGAMEDLTIKDIPWDTLGQYDHLHLSNYFLQKGIQKDIIQVFKQAKEAGLTTSLDLQVDPENKWNFDYKNVLPFVDIFLPNQSELLGLTGMKNLESAIAEIKPYVNTIVVKMGYEGAMLISEDKKYTLKPFLNKKFRDAIGAGDSFNAGFIHEYLKEASWEECLENANLMGSLSTTFAGGTAAFTSTDEIQEKKQQIQKKEL
ncbi:carbohydrate kinase family protein [Gramella sp. AN32]|uniref:Carbohydrate kinase family protein n=1 Tax=Christiangramia antarctica TaxID=2058158 RepID=A0ABW5X4E5_9FLAO|nr:carbohydrate kinase family protein [Gramella sp. AN32]MCM4157032.1 carbohydrate kinase family protein [Gramella sp. AN32]